MQAMQGLRTVEDAEFMRIIANETTEKYGDDASTMYQAHRLLLWAGDIDGASRIVPKILNSELPENNRYLVELRQACAEQRIDDAKKLHARGVEMYSDSIGIQWLGYKIIGDDKSAALVFDEYDAEDDFDTIADYLSYPHFDPSLYPNFMRAVAGQGIENRVLLDLPYRCNR